MNYGINSRKVKRELKKKVSYLLPDLGFRNGRVRHEEVRFNTNGSLSICLSGSYAGRWQHFEYGIGGDVFELIMWANSMSFCEAKHWAYEWLILSDVPRGKLLNV